MWLWSCCLSEPISPGFRAVPIQIQWFWYLNLWLDGAVLCGCVLSFPVILVSSKIILNCMCRYIPGYWFFLQLILNYLYNWTVSARWKFTSYFWISLWPSDYSSAWFKAPQVEKEILTKISIICRACLEAQNILYLISFWFSIWYTPNCYV